MDIGVFCEIQVASPFKHRECEYQVFHPLLDQVMHAEQAGFGSFGMVKHHFGKHGIPYFKNKYA